jgi:hypothetical protein
MDWPRNRRLVEEGFRDLAYVPRDRTGWDMTLASLAFGVRRVIERHPPDLNGWAARHGASGSRRFEELGRDATVLWHGTSRERAARIREHGLFHFKGLWTTFDPSTAHLFCRSRSARFATEGAMVCLLLDERELEEGRHYEAESGGEIRRFHGPLPPEVVEYVLVREEIRFVGEERAREPAPWREAQFKKQSGAWLTKQRAPVRFSRDAGYSTVEEFARLTVERLLEELGELAPIEVFSALYALVRPWEALRHEAVMALIEAACAPARRREKIQFLKAAR